MKRFLIIIFAMLALIVKAQKGNEVIVDVIDRDIANVVIEGIKDPKLVRFRLLNQTDKAI